MSAKVINIMVINGVHTIWSSPEVAIPISLNSDMATSAEQFLGLFNT